jgi:hypothetical protein
MNSHTIHGNPPAGDWRRLAPFEEYMLCDDRPGWPMTFWIRLEFSRALDTERLQQAVLATAARHPLLSARIARDRRGRPYWVPASPEGIVHRYESSKSATRVPTEATIDLASEAPWRVWKSVRDDDPIVWLEFHHAVCDGAGAFRALDDLLIAYRDGAPLPSLLVHDKWDQVARRHRTDTLTRFRDRVGHWFWMIWRIVAYLITSPASLDARKPGAVEAEHRNDKDRAAAEIRSCSLGSVQAFRAAARQRECTINDLILRDFLDSLADVFSRRQPTRRHRLRLFVPMDLRGNPENQCEVANVVGMLHLDRLVGPGDTGSISLPHLAKEMSFYRRHRMGRALVVSIEAATFLLGSPRLLLNPNQCFSTSVLTNLRDPLTASELTAADGRVHVGSTILESIDVVPPVRSRTPACFGVITYGDELRLSMRFQPEALSTDEAEFLFDRMVQRLNQSTESQPANQT